MHTDAMDQYSALKATLGCISASLLLLQQDGVQRMTPVQMGYFKTIEYGLSQVRDQPLDRFESIDIENLPEEFIRQSNHFLKTCLRRSALPTGDSGMTARLFLADKGSDYDLIEYLWKYESVELRLVQSINAMKLEIPIEDNPNEPERLASVVSTVVQLEGTDSFGNDYTVTLPWPTTLKNGARFSSNPDQPINTMGPWHHRMDAIVENNKCCLVFYNRIIQRVGFRDGFGWIRGEMDATRTGN